MSAQTPWFICGRCGFKNHPRLNQDQTRCEQCGADGTVDLPNIGTSKFAGTSRDYDPALSPGVA